MPPSGPREPVSEHDRHVLRTLAARVAAAAREPIQAERIALWQRHNDLDPVRPLMLIFPEGSWGELVFDHPHPRLDDPWLGRLAADFLMRLYTHEHFAAADNVIDATVEVPKVVHSTGWGPEAQWTFSHDPRGARAFQPVIATPRDLETKLQHPVIRHDADASARNHRIVADLLGDILPVRLVGLKHVSFHLHNQWTAWHGLEETLLDMADEPGFVHAAMEFLTRGHEKLIDQYEALGLFDLNTDNTYHSTGGNAWSAEPPRPDFDPARVRAADLWASAESQELEVVSPAMHDEFATRYEARLLRRFRHNGYGCCEGLHHKLDGVLQVPGIRRVSMSPFARVDVAIPRLGRQAIFSWKPHPARLVGEFREDLIRAEIRHALEQARDHGTILEIILKDTHTCDHQPARFDRWTVICREEIDRLWPAAN